MDDIQLTVLFATYNGERVLERTLGGYLRLVPPKVGWELIVVDNGSTDGSLGILENYRVRLPIRVISEQRPGKNRALNAGIQARRGRLVVLTDDDAIPDKYFLVAWERLLDRHLDFDLFGGRIKPLFETPPPAWLAASPQEYAMMFAERDFPDGEIGAGECYGGNMAIRGRVFDAGHRFDENIGPTAADQMYPMGSEVEFGFRLERQQGARSRFVREALVNHIVRSAQFTKVAWINRSFRTGRGRAYIMHAHARPVRRPAATLLDLLLTFSPIPRHRFRGLRSWHLQRGFDMEDAKWRDGR